MGSRGTGVSDPWLVLLFIKMAAAAGIVVSCSLVAERSGPVMAAMIATLPISAGPVLAFLALDHDATFVAEAALGSMAANLATSGMALMYVRMAQTQGTAVSLATALTVWVAIATSLRIIEPPAAVMVGATVAVYAGLYPLLRPFLDARPAAAPARLWYAIPIRAAGVALLAAAVTMLSNHVGSGWSGTLGALPIVFSSLIAMLQPRLGGPAVAAIVANSVLGLMGFGLALATVHYGAMASGSWVALLLGLLVSVAWNLGLIGLSWRRAAAGART